MTFYRVDLLAQPIVRPGRRFRTEEQARKHARKIFGLADDSGLASRVSIVAVNKDGIERPM